MQRIRTNGWKRIILEVLPVIILAVLIVVDQVSKTFFCNLWHEQGDTIVIKDFFCLTYTVNTGAAWSFLSGVSWAQTFFKVLTSISLVAFIIYYVYSVKKGYSWLKYSLVLIIGGTIGNFIDRLVMNGVIDFLSFTFWGNPFPVFNFADSFLTVGVIMLIVHYLFLDANAIFKKKKNVNSVDGEENVENDKSSIDGN